MNRLTFIKILKETFKVFLKHNAEIEVTDERREEYEKVIETFSIPTKIDDDIITYNEVEFLCDLFETVPYYLVSQIAQDYEKNLYLLFNQTQKKHLANMLTAYLRDLSPNYNRRINSEICAHVSALLSFYLLYSEKELEQDYLLQKQITILDQNLYDPGRLFGLGQAESFRYTQESLFKEENMDSVRETVGKSNYMNADKIEKEFLAMVQQLSSFDEYTKFRQYLKGICAKHACCKCAEWKQSDKKSLDYKLANANDFSRIARLINIYLDDLNKTIKLIFKEKENQTSENPLLVYFSK